MADAGVNAAIVMDLQYANMVDNGVIVQIAQRWKKHFAVNVSATYVQQQYFQQYADILEFVQAVTRTSHQEWNTLSETKSKAT
jgi:hypothetical protein